MTDKNGIEIKTGSIVEITGSFFKTDNGLYYVEHSAGDPDWCGKDHYLHKISKAGKISKAKRSGAFWPLMACVSDRAKNAEARRWNAEHATIEVKAIANMTEVVELFKEKAARVIKEADQLAWHYGEESEYIKKQRVIARHYEAVAAGIEG